ncbi:conserved Plasmodium protein, unknown function [Plasmodium sp. DRC-Itaito]|nr:conserved Plasmodium protein, unknown function [Plasmodium sp. DRC-Itaito]
MNNKKKKRTPKPINLNELEEKINILNFMKNDFEIILEKENENHSKVSIQNTNKEETSTIERERINIILKELIISCNEKKEHLNNYIKVAKDIIQKNNETIEKVKNDIDKLILQKDEQIRNVEKKIVIVQDFYKDINKGIIQLINNLEVYLRNKMNININIKKMNDKTIELINVQKLYEQQECKENEFKNILYMSIDKYNEQISIIRTFIKKIKLKEEIDVIKEDNIINTNDHILSKSSNNANEQKEENNKNDDSHVENENNNSRQYEMINIEEDYDKKNNIKRDDKLNTNNENANSCDEHDSCDEDDSCEEDDNCEEDDSCEEDDGCEEDDSSEEDDGCEEDDSYEEDDSCEEHDSCEEDDSCEEHDSCDEKLEKEQLHNLEDDKKNYMLKKNINETLLSSLDDDNSKFSSSNSERTKSFEVYKDKDKDKEIYNYLYSEEETYEQKKNNQSSNTFDDDKKEHFIKKFTTLKTNKNILNEDIQFLMDKIKKMDYDYISYFEKKLKYK